MNRVSQAAALALVLMALGLGGCSGRLEHEAIVSKNSDPQAGELLQSNVDRGHPGHAR